MTFDGIYSISMLILGSFAKDLVHSTHISTSPSLNAHKLDKHEENDDEYDSSSDEDYSDDEDEGLDGYRPGGYHPVITG